MTERGLVAIILLSIFTLGIYALYWMIVFQIELKKETDEGFNGFGHFLMLFFTLGIYSIYWQYAAGKRLAKQGAEDNSVLYLILALFGLSIVNMALMQNQANSLK
ncbi:MAG: DUF4234 domain-containing protein [Candidatus Izemoplasma sp.]